MTQAVPKTPKTMRGVVVAEPGGPEQLQVAECPVPEPRAGEVLVRVSHAGINRPDVMQRKGLYPPPPDASPLPGLEVAGEIVAVGADVDSAMLGQPVCALANGGGYAEYCAVPAGQCLPVPEGLAMAEAAALPETLFTVWSNLFERAYLAPGETLLVHGGTSGIGTMAIKLAKLFGVTIIVTCGSDEKCSIAKELGADHAINYKQQNFVDAVAEITDGKGVHVVLDMIAGDYVPRNMKCLREDGRHVTIAVQGGLKAEVSMVHVMTRRLTLTGSTLRPRSAEFKAAVADELIRHVWPFVADGRLRPVMDRIFPLAEACEAHRRMEAGDHVGKIVLEV